MGVANSIWRFLSDPRGAAAVEMALLTPVLVVLLSGMADLGKLAFDDVRLTAAARTGAQYGVDWAVLNGLTDYTGADTAVTNGVATAMPTGTSAKMSGQSHYLYCICVPNDGSGQGAATSCGGSCASGQTLDTYVGVTVSERATVPITLFNLGSSQVLTGQAILRVN